MFCKVTAVMNEPAMAGWDIINQPEGVMKRNVTDKNPCWDNTFLELKSSGRAIGWAKELYTPKEIQRQMYFPENIIVWTFFSLNSLFAKHNVHAEIWYLFLWRVKVKVGKFYYLAHINVTFV